MLVHSITGINTHKQRNPYITRYAGSAMTGARASLISFDECLRAQIRDYRSNAMSYNSEWQVAGLLGGYYTPPAAPVAVGLKLKGHAYEPGSEL